MISNELRTAALSFGAKYGCTFDFEAFEATFTTQNTELIVFNPNEGWTEKCKNAFVSLYKQSLERFAYDKNATFDAEDMLDEFETELISPYVDYNRQNDVNIDHTPYFGMDRMTRLGFLDEESKKAPSSYVEFYTGKYATREIRIRDMRSIVSAIFANPDSTVEDFQKVAGFVKALEDFNNKRTFWDRFFHPFQNRAEQKVSAKFKTMLDEKFASVGKGYGDFVYGASLDFKPLTSLQEKIKLDMRDIAIDLEIEEEDKVNESIVDNEPKNEKEVVHFNDFGEEKIKEKSPIYEENVIRHDDLINSK